LRQIQLKVTLDETAGTVNLPGRRQRNRSLFAEQIEHQSRGRGVTVTDLIVSAPTMEKLRDGSLVEVLDAKAPSLQPPAQIADDAQLARHRRAGVPVLL
jgi:hypothetical protein